MRPIGFTNTKKCVLSFNQVIHGKASLVETRFSKHRVGFHFDDEFLDDGWICFLKKGTHNDFGLIVSKKTFQLKQGDIVS